MRVAVVGPTFPLKGGVAAHTTELAHRLAAAGDDVRLVSWSRLYPRLLYPGEQTVPAGVPDVAPFPGTTRPLSWSRPDSWVRTGRALRAAGVERVVLVHVVPAVVPAHLALLRALGRDVPVTVVAHNVLPHEAHPGAQRLTRALLRRASTVVVHSSEQGDLARGLGARDVRVVPLPAHLPGGPAQGRAPYDGPARLLALGIVRHYKGVDLLLDALAQVPGPTLTVAGELWGDAGARVRGRAATMPGRVVLRDGYVPASALAGLLAEHDVLALPYRSGTASQNALLAFAHGLPVLATRTGSFEDDVRDGVDGLLVPPGDVSALADAVRRLADPAELDRLRAGVRPPDLEGPWRAYRPAVLGEPA